MEHLDWNKVFDRYLSDRTMEVESWEQLDDTQKLIINEVKKSMKRFVSKENAQRNLQ